MPKAKPNGYLMFMDEYIQQRAAVGHNINRSQAQSLCSDSWKALSDEKKHEYKLRAQGSVKNIVKYTTDGIPIAQIEREILRQMTEKEKLETDICHMIQDLDRGSSLEEQLFYVIHCNIFCRTDDKRYIPAEIAIIEFNLLNGQCSFFHRIVDPEDIPPAYLHAAKDLSDKTHKIPYPRAGIQAQVVNKEPIDTVFLELSEWFRSCFKAGPVPILFAWEDNVEITRGVIDELNKSCLGDKLMARIASASWLLFCLKNLCASGSSRPQDNFPYVSTATDELARDVFAYTDGIACEFHELSELCENRFHYCSLSFAKRLMFSVCDHCCQLVDIELIPGQHCPNRAITMRNTPMTDRSYGGSQDVSGCSTPSNFAGGDNSDGWSSTASRRGKKTSLAPIALSRPASTFDTVSNAASDCWRPSRYEEVDDSDTCSVSSQSLAGIDNVDAWPSLSSRGSRPGRGGRGRGGFPRR